MEPIPPWSEAAQALRLGVYEHYSTGAHRVLGVVRHSETLEEMVHYEHLSDQSQWVRPLAMFLEEVTYQGVRQPRFRFVDNHADKK